MFTQLELGDYGLISEFMNEQLIWLQELTLKSQQGLHQTSCETILLVLILEISQSNLSQDKVFFHSCFDFQFTVKGHEALFRRKSIIWKSDDIEKQGTNKKVTLLKKQLLFRLDFLQKLDLTSIKIDAVLLKYWSRAYKYLQTSVGQLVSQEVYYHFWEKR